MCAMLGHEYVGAFEVQPDGGVVLEGRLRAIMARLRPIGEGVIYTAYLHDGVGPAAANQLAVEALLRHASGHARLWLTARDWNMAPSLLA